MVEAILDDFETAPIDDKLRTMLRFIEKLTLNPEQIAADDIAPLKAVGLDDHAIEEAIHVCALFNIYDRLADAFGFELPPEEIYEASGKVLLQRGYIL